MRYCRTELAPLEKCYAVNAFPLGSCFSKEQFADMMHQWGLTVNDTDKIYSIGFGC